MPGISTNVDLDVLYFDPVTLGEMTDQKPDAVQDSETSYIFMMNGISKAQADQLLNTAKIMNIEGTLYKSV